ncbi:MAG: NFACT RNA binding domain-containing protein [Ignavibacteriae bacterium]|nr:NFACT RNA binding domain-containing protein [Ignavibacteriota bacterium]
MRQQDKVYRLALLFHRNLWTFSYQPMLTNYYTLRFIAQDLNRTLSGSVIAQIFTQYRDELVISCEWNTSECHVILSCDPVRNYILRRDEFPRAKRNSVDLFKKLHGARLSEVTIHPSDRQVVFHTDRQYSLIAQLFGAKSNVLLVKDGIIEDSFLKRKEYAGKSLGERRPFTPPQSADEFHKALISSDAELQPALKRCFPSFGSEAVREIIHRADLEPDTHISHLTSDNAQRLFETSNETLMTLAQHPSPRIYFEGNKAETFSIIELRHLAHLRCEEYDSIHEAIRIFLSSSQRAKGFQDEKKPLALYLEQALTKAERALAKIVEEEQSAARASLYETSGKLLMANLHAISKGMKSIELENIFSPSRETLTIALEPGLTPAKNAERYFDKAKKSRHRSEESGERKEELERRRNALRTLLDALDEVDEPDEYKEFLSRHTESLAELGYKLASTKATKREEPLPFRVFTVSGGFQVWAGKSSENNDLLTMKYAKPDDLWFHARGASGSHVVLKIGTANGNPSKLAIQQAAGIAAYYSKMKNAKLVPVAMTERKYVRKPKGARAGTVMLEREKTIFAEPRLPE